MNLGSLNNSNSYKDFKGLNNNYVSDFISSQEIDRNFDFYDHGKSSNFKT